MLSRLPEGQQRPEKDENIHFSYINDMPVSATEIAHQRKEDITLEAGVLQWSLRVIIPQKFRKQLLNEFHEKHLGTNKTKATARCYVYWPKIDNDIESMIKTAKTVPRIRTIQLHFSCELFHHTHENEFILTLLNARDKNIF